MTGDDGMDLDKFSREVEAARERLAELFGNPAAVEAGVPRLAEVVEELATAMEQLRVAEHELHVQGEEIDRRVELLQEAEEALEQQTRLYRDLFEQAPDGYLVTNRAGTIREANEAAAILLGRPLRFLKGKPIAIFAPDEGRTAFRAELAHLARAPRLAHLEMRLRTRGRDPFPAAVTVAPILGRDDKLAAFRWTIRDLTPLKRAEDLLRNQNIELERRVAERTAQLEAEFAERERLLFRAHAASTGDDSLLEWIGDVDAIIWRADAETGRPSFISARAEEILGHPVRRWLADPEFWVQILHPDDREYVLSTRARALREGRDFEAEFRMLAADGRVVWFRGHTRVVRDEQGRPRELRGLMVNVSKRKKFERQLFASREELSARLDDLTYLQELGGRLRTSRDLQPILREVLTAVMAVQGAEKGVVRLYDRDRDVLVLAAAAGLDEPCLRHIAELPLGVAAGGIVAATCARVVYQDVQAEAVDPHDEEAARLGGYRALYCTPLLTRDGELLGTIATYFVEPHRPPERHIHLVELYARQAAHFIEDARLFAELRETARRKEEFLATLSHELRNPLAALQSALHVLRLPDAGAPARALAVLDRQVGQLARLVDDLLDASRIAQGKVELRKEPLDVADAAGRAADSLRPGMDERELTLTVTRPPGPLPLEADPTRLEQVLVNLLNNAAKFTDPGGRIELETGREGDEVFIRVHDTGVGITPEMLPRVFDLFAQAEGGADRAHGGLGIGLALVRSLVELHGGSVTASSPGPGLGSEFVVRLPVATTPADGEAPESESTNGQARNGPPTAPRHVLLVDGHRDAADMLARLVRSWGLGVEVANDGPSALDVADRRRPDLVLLDVSLPGMDGYEVARRLRRRWPDLRVVALTGHLPPRDRPDSETLFDRYLVKPLNPDDLRRVIGTMAT
jgi:PAS domain S-box-containing protein